VVLAAPMAAGVPASTSVRVPTAKTLATAEAFRRMPSANSLVVSKTLRRVSAAVELA